ncbi:glycoside hydrolase family protein [Lyngbya sp. PCC 8106]|uniref:glycoside hydrolase family protein n=1 Tax=Lyngbya sp. (strain PCC 8106) TaxID=313612 RepID=UPI0000EA8FED|nr:glycoside hydrolase family protein [Lyngbya sp. PCC 8106]EAW35266.1 probable phage-related lysozyme [Lyngbya sp. PCC 8106]
MERTLKIFDDYRVYEFEGNQPLRVVDTQGKVSQLIKVLQFTLADTFTVEPTNPIPRGDMIPPRSSRRKINPEGIKLIKAFEGVELEAYLDAVGVPTIGYGHTKDVFLGMTITQAEAEELLRQDIEEFEIAVEDAVEVEINDHQFSALVSFCFNLGAGSLFKSTLLKFLNVRKLQEASLEFPRWNKAGGQPLLGLTRRRMAERALFLGKPWQPFLEYELLQLTQPKIKSEYVRYVQQGLQKAGFDIQKNGVFDLETDAAMKKFQAQKRLDPDGLVGPITITELGL